MKEGDSRDKVHSAQLYQIGMTRIYENERKKEYSLTTKRTEYKVRHITPIDGIPGLDLLFVVFENCVANIYDISRGMLLIHQLEYDREFDVDPQRYINKRNSKKRDQHALDAQASQALAIKKNEQSQDQLLVGDSIADGLMGQTSPFQEIKEEPEDFEKDTKEDMSESVYSKTVQPPVFQESERQQSVFKTKTKIIESKEFVMDKQVKGLKDRRKTIQPKNNMMALQTIQEKITRHQMGGNEESENARRKIGRAFNQTMSMSKVCNDLFSSSQNQIFDVLEKKNASKKRQAFSVGRQKPPSQNQSLLAQQTVNNNLNQTARLSSKLRGMSANRRKFSVPKQINDGMEILGLTDLRQYDTRIGDGKQVDTKVKRETEFIPPAPVVVPRPTKTGKVLVGDLLPEDMLRYGIPENLFSRKSEISAAKDEHTLAIRKLNEKINQNNGELALNKLKNNQKPVKRKFPVKRSPSNQTLSSKLGFYAGQEKSQEKMNQQESIQDQDLTETVKNQGNQSRMNQSISRASLSSDKSRQSKSRHGSISNFKLMNKHPIDRFSEGARLIDRKQRERKNNAKKMFDQIKPDIDQLVAKQHIRRKIDSHSKGIRDMPKFNYHTKSIEVTCTTQSLNKRLQKVTKQEDEKGEKISLMFQSPDEAGNLQKKVDVKVERLEHDMKILSDLFDDKYIKQKEQEVLDGQKVNKTTANFRPNDEEGESQIQKKPQNNIETTEQSQKQDVINIKAAPKEKNIKPGGGVDVDQDTTIPRVASCHWYPASRLLIICLVNQELMLYKIRGMVKKNLDIDRIHVSYKNPFAIEHSKIGVHKITKELILVMIGQRQVLAIGIDPKSKLFMKPINDSGKPKFIPQPSKKYYTLSMKASVSKDLMTSLAYDETLGIVITYYNGNFRMYDPFNFQREIWYHPEMNLNEPDQRKDQDNITFVTSALTKKLGILAIGGREGKVYLYDLSAQYRIGMNDKVHESEILKIFFYDAENQMISISKDRQISLWDANKFEQLQTIKDQSANPIRFTMAIFDEKQKRLFLAAYRLAIYNLNLNEKVELEAVQTKALADQNKERMCELLLNESKEHRDTKEGNIVYNQLLVEQSGFKKQINNFMDKALALQLAEKIETNAKEEDEKFSFEKAQVKPKNYRKQKNKIAFSSYRKKPRDFGKAIIGKHCSLVSVELLSMLNPLCNPDAQRIYTIDSDFMIRTWDLSNDGQCKQSTILMKCQKYNELMSAADKFRLDMGAYSSSDNDHGLKRKLDCVDITSMNGKYPQLVAACDDSGIIQLNNFQTGNILLSLANRRNKAELTKIHFLKSSSTSGKLCMVATCTDGRVMFFTKPNIRLDKESQPSDVSQTLIKSGTHDGELYAICSDDQWVAVGGRDNKISFWKASSGALSTTVTLPQSRADLNEQKKPMSPGKESGNSNLKNKNSKYEKPNLIHISDMKFLSQVGSGRSKASYLLVLQNNGAAHIAHPTSNSLIQAFIFQSGCSNGLLSTSQDGRCSIFICNDSGKVAETYRFYKNQFERNQYIEKEEQFKEVPDLQSDSSCASEKVEKLRGFANANRFELNPDCTFYKESIDGPGPSQISFDSSIKFETFKNQEKIITDSSLDRKAKIGQWLDAVLEKKKLKIMEKQQSAHTKERYLQYKQNKGGLTDQKDEFNAIFEKVASWNPFNPQIQPTKEGMGAQIQDENDPNSNLDQDVPYLVSAKILGGGLCVCGMSNGVVRLFDFLTGNLIYTLNTSSMYEYPKHKILKCIKLDISKIKAKNV